MLRNRNASPNVTYNDSLRVAVYGERKRTQPLTADRMNEVSFDRIYQIYNERFSNLSGMNLIITGDIREDDFEELICQYVASLPGKKNTNNDCKPGEYTLDIQEGKVTKVFHKEMATPSAQTNIVYSAPIAYTADTDLKLDVLSQIMRGVYTEKVREEKGGTYGVNVEGQFWRYPATHGRRWSHRGTTGKSEGICSQELQSRRAHQRMVGIRALSRTARWHRLQQGLSAEGGQSNH